MLVGWTAVATWGILPGHLQHRAVMNSTRINPLLELHSRGQSVWLDYIRRDLISSGELARLIAEDGLRGMTSNPAIFEKAFTASAEYAEAMAAAARASRDPGALYESLACARCTTRPVVRTAS
jgi:transaldolase/glucose-6-phosphate isomerase